MTETTRMSAVDMIHQSLADAQEKDFQGNKWGERHAEFWSAVVRDRAGGKTMGGPIVRMVEAFAIYADKHYKRYGSLIGDDGVLGPAWVKIGASIIDLLNGETGDLDCGTVDSLIRQIATANGANGDDL